MQERGEGRRGGYVYDDEQINGYGGADETRRVAGYGPRQSAPAPRGPRTGLVVGAVVVAAALAVGAVVAVNASGKKKDDIGAQAAATASATSALTSVSATASASASGSAAASVPAAPKGTLITLSPGAESVGDFYGAALYAVLPNGQPMTISPTAFTSSAVAAKYWDASKKKPKPAALCGFAAPNLALVADGGGVVNVSLATNGKPEAQEAHVAVDPKTGRISGITCAGAVPLSYVGGAQLVNYFGGLAYEKESLPTGSKTYAPKSADGPEPFMNYDGTTCSQDVPQTWVFYAPIATSAGEAWQFSSDGNAQVEDVFLNPATGAFERTLCETFPRIPAPDKKAAGKTSEDAPFDPAMSLVGGVFDAYLVERSQISHGAVPTDEIAAYFDSASAYSAALRATGAAHPFLCGAKAPDGEWVGSAKVSGSTETVEVTLTNGGEGPSTETSPTSGKEKVVVDLDTMKIKSITCG